MEEDGQMCIDTFTSFKNTKTKFPLGSAWEEYTADGRTAQTVTTIEGNVIVKVQTPDAATGYHTTREEREFSDDGATMTLRLIIPAKPEIVCTRIYKRVVPTTEGESENKDEAPEENVAQWATLLSRCKPLTQQLDTTLPGRRESSLTMAPL